MGNEWPLVPLKDVGEWLSGGTPSKSNSAYWNGDIPWISAKSMKGTRFYCSYFNLTREGLENGSRLVDPGVILLLVRGSILHQRIPVGIAGRPLSFNQDVKAIIPSEDFIPEFLLYWFLANERMLLAKVDNTGVGAGRLPTDVLNCIQVPCPPIEEQQAIVQVLGSLDDKIELNRQMNQTLEQMAQTLFKSWFIDFDPVVYNAVQASNPVPEEFEETAARYREDPEIRPVAPDLLEAFPDSFVDSALGPTPKGWEVGPLTQVATLEAKTVHPGKNPNTFWEHYSIPAYDEGCRPYWEYGESIKSGKYQVPRNSVLASKLNPRFPRIWLPDGENNEVAVCSTEFMPFVPVKEAWRPYLYELLKSRPVQERIRSHASGSTGSRQRVKPREIAEMPVLVPKSDILDGFSQVVGSFHNQILGNRGASQVLGETRDTVLPKLISGELRVPDVEEMANTSERVSASG